MRTSDSIDIVYNYIKDQIVSRGIFPGNRLIEEDIARKTGVSRISVRGALARLENEGYVESSPNRSACLITPSKEEMVQVFEVRLLLETAAARLAIDKITDEGIEAMEKKVKECNKFVEKFNITEYVAINREIHWEIIGACGNPYYEKFLSELYNKCTIYLMFFDNSEIGAAIESHQAMLDAVKKRDIKALEKALKKDLCVSM
ncbi:MAG: GntR family transcriptional regulator [Clostridia bacterium]|nr:GntR family transcriptional regulator [Clostridia bacterium]MBR2472408.1 GntR family transcriptional regulator [Clostridia bacterium]MBR3865260.1 GntR family transcriptional regulator [Clostridia bacterium]